MKISIDSEKIVKKYEDKTRFYNTTLRFAPPKDFPPVLEKVLGRSKIIRLFITLDEFYDLPTDTYDFDYAIGVAKRDYTERYYPYDWQWTAPSPSNIRFVDYLTSHAQISDEILLNVRRYEREVTDGIITYEQYEDLFYKAVEYCKKLAPNIKYIECCNEVDIKTFGDLTPDDYVKIYGCARRAIDRLNEKYHYDVPLCLGGYGAAVPLVKWEFFTDIVKKIYASGNKMDFYSVHFYALPCIKTEEKNNVTAYASMSAAEKIEFMLRRLKGFISENGYNEGLIFFDEFGYGRHSGSKEVNPYDALKNAANDIVYFNMLSCAFGFDNVCPYPWCSFHNPDMQIAYTQFIADGKGNYLLTPNGIMIYMMANLKGNIVRCDISGGEGDDIRYRAMTTYDGKKMSVICTNPTDNDEKNVFEISGLEDGEYTVTEYLCSDELNNCITGSGDGKMNVTAKYEASASDGNLSFSASLTPYGFALYEIEKK